ncbi:MAG: winged helix-turn-helix transcriptional regulator [Gammaproteobacteria bacterium]|nr:MAG: winged helix-turn-helix transcriptional regulator [Gammaproteobacteria bacterium]
MTSTPNLAAIGQLIGDPTRSLMLEMLYDGRDWTASELARAAGISPQTASSHLRKLVDANLLEVEAQGRHRFFRLAGVDVAEALEALLVLATQRIERPGIKRIKNDPLRNARTCYDHLAGNFGVGLIEQFLHKAFILESEDGYRLTEKGNNLMDDLGIDTLQLRNGRRPFTRKCLDWSERRYHLGGALGAALATTFLENQWVRHIDDTRALLVTAAGKRRLQSIGLTVE